MIRYCASSICCFLMVALCATAEGQFLRFGGYGYGGGVSIRVPFVSVDVLPFGGGTRVRAPLTSVNTGAYGFSPYSFGRAYPGFRDPYPYGRVIYDPVPLTVYDPVPLTVYDPVPVRVYEPAPIYSPPHQSYFPPASVTLNETYQSSNVNSYPTTTAALPDRLRSAATRLSRSLSNRRDDGDIWLDYLGPHRIVDVIDVGGDPATLGDLLANYDGVTHNSQLSSISSAAGFAETRVLLQQFVSSQGAAPSMPGNANEETIRVPEAVDNAPSVIEPNEPDLLPAPPPEPDPQAAGAPTPAEPVKAAEDDAESDDQEEPTPL